MNTMKHTFPLLIAVAFLSEARAQDVKRNIPYAEPAHERQVLDVYSPHNAKNLPVVFWIHGGGWQTGDKTSVQMKPQAFMDGGFVFVSTNYRLLPSVDMATIVRDIAKSIRWVHDHVAEHPDTSAQAQRLGNALKDAGVPVTVFGAKETTHSKINADLGVPDDPATKALFEFLGKLKVAVRGEGKKKEITLPAPIPQKPSFLHVLLRQRLPAANDPDRFEVVQRNEQWDPKKTAIIVCDMWDLHHCKRAVNRVKEMAPRMNEVIAKARDQGVLIIHAPSDCMAAYENTPMRQRAKNAPPAKNLPKDIASWCDRIPAEEKGRYPIDQSDGGEDDEPAEHSQWAAYLTSLGRNPKAPWKKEIDDLEIKAQDAVSDSGVEIWNLLEERGIHNVMLMGVHTNMCVLGRPFGLRQMAKNGKHVVLMRDLTDTMYNPARWPYISHFEGTERIIEHIEKFVCPTTTSDQIMGGKPFRFDREAEAHRP